MLHLIGCLIGCVRAVAVVFALGGDAAAEIAVAAERLELVAAMHEGGWMNTNKG